MRDCTYQFSAYAAVERQSLYGAHAVSLNARRLQHRAAISGAAVLYVFGDVIFEREMHA
jgi:hypothetical protein